MAEMLKRDLIDGSLKSVSPEKVQSLVANTELGKGFSVAEPENIRTNDAAPENDTLENTNTPSFTPRMR